MATEPTRRTVLQAAGAVGLFQIVFWQSLTNLNC